MAHDFTELICWQLATELKVRVADVLARPTAARDWKFCDQIRESTRSAPANIAEGFGRYEPPEFRRFLRIAAGSLTETQNHLREALTRRYVSLEDFNDLYRLSRRARKATLGLMAYLEKCPRRPRKRPQSDTQSPRDGRT